MRIFPQFGWIIKLRPINAVESGGVTATSISSSTVAKLRYNDVAY